jgi:hypothetical protein
LDGGGDEYKQHRTWPERLTRQEERKIDVEKMRSTMLVDCESCIR